MKKLFFAALFVFVASSVNASAVDSARASYSTVEMLACAQLLCSGGEKEYGTSPGECEEPMDSLRKKKKKSRFGKIKCYATRVKRLNAMLICPQTAVSQGKIWDWTDCD